VLPPQMLSSTHEAIIMFTFERPTACDYCHKMLKGLFYQGYRCERCGRNTHKECISLLPKCGTRPGVPPARPLRPPSMLPTGSNGVLSNRLSSCSLDDTPASQLHLDRQASLASLTSVPPSMPPVQEIDFTLIKTTSIIINIVNFLI